MRIDEKVCCIQRFEEAIGSEYSWGSDNLAAVFEYVRELLLAGSGSLVEGYGYALGSL